MPSALAVTPTAVLAFVAVQTATTVGTEVFSSPDGVVWSALPTLGLDEAGITVFGAVAERGNVLTFGSAGGADGRPAAWTSDDGGVYWRPVVVPFESDLPFGAVGSAIPTASGLLLLGAARTSTLSAMSAEDGTALVLDGDADVVAWLSRDGARFEPLDTSMVNTARWNMVTAATHAGAGALVAYDSTDTTGRTTHLVSWSSSAGFVAEDAGGLSSVGSLVDHGGAFLAMARAANDFMEQPSDLSTVLWRAPHR